MDDNLSAQPSIVDSERSGGHAYLCEIRSFQQCHSETIGQHEKSCEFDLNSASGDRLPVRMGHSLDREMRRPTREAPN